LTSLAKLADAIDRFSTVIGRATAWVALAMVLAQFLVVLLRYIFGVGSIMLQESVTYMHAFLFMVGAGYTLLQDGHVRVDIFYRGASERFKNVVDVVGVIVFLMPACLVIGFYSWPYVHNSWKVFEGSKETSGIQGIYLLKSLLIVFAVLVAVQGVSLAARSLLSLMGVGRTSTQHDDVSPA
jgi:TRAP-type mannitol/chloroaromatic compound transport system permease small subunit